MPLKKLLADYKALLKPLPLEGIPDLVIFRPPAFLLVQILKRFPVTPDQVSYSAVVTGVAAAACFAIGSRLSFAAAGVLYAVTVVLDCADGMLARLKRAGSPLGRIIDGFVDYTNGTAIMIGLAVGLERMRPELPLDSWILTALAGASMAVHCVVVDHFRSQFSIHALGKREPLSDLIREQEALLSKGRGRDIPLRSRFMIRLSLAYHKAQSRIVAGERRFDARKYYAYHKVTLRAWTMIELTMHILALIVSAFLYDPRVFFVYAIVAANVWMVLLAPVQYAISRRIEVADPPGGSPPSSAS